MGGRLFQANTGVPRAHFMLYSERETSVRSRAVVSLITSAREWCDYALHEKGEATQSSTLDQPFAKLVPTLASLTPIQKTNATRTTTNVYSIRPCPSSSTQSRFNKSISIPPV